MKTGENFQVFNFYFFTVVNICLVFFCCCFLFIIGYAKVENKSHSIQGLAMKCLASHGPLASLQVQCCKKKKKKKKTRIVPCSSWLLPPSVSNPWAVLPASWSSSVVWLGVVSVCMKFVENTSGPNNVINSFCS